MKKETLKQLTDAHSWLGLIISGALMIVFICGSLSFFKPNIHAWEKYHHKDKTLPKNILSPSQITKIILDRNYQIPSDHRMLLLFPSDNTPQYQAYFSTESSNGSHKRHKLFFDPETGDEIEKTNQNYYLAEYLYKLHIDLNIPAGLEIVGIVSLIFLVIIFSGIVIHLRKLVKYFYQYRIKKSKDTYLDGHNIIGVTSLPYTFMYALTGVMFNLSILIQGGFGFLVYQGDINALSQTSGFTSPINIQANGKPMDWKNLDLAIEHANQQLPNTKVYLAKIFAFGDGNAKAELRLIDTNSVTERLTITYPLKNIDNSSQTHVLDNPVQGTYHVLKQLHYGNFGGVTLLIIYFFIGLGCCYLILTGNLIWLEKRALQRKSEKQHSFNFVSSMTLCLSVGCLIAVAFCFIGTRFLPMNIARTEALPYLFSAGLVLSFLHAFWLKNSRSVMQKQAVFAGVLFAICPIYDSLIILLGYISKGSLLDLMLVNLMCLCISAFCFVFAYYKRNSPQTNETDRTKAIEAEITEG